MKSRYKSPRPLPIGLGAGEQPSEYDCINRVRNEVEGLYLDLMSCKKATHEDRLRVLLLRENLVRAEAEITYAGTTKTLDQTHHIARTIAAQFGFDLVDLERELQAA